MGSNRPLSSRVDRPSPVAVPGPQRRATSGQADDIVHVAMVQGLHARDAQLVVRVVGVVDLVTAPSLATGLALALDNAARSQDVTEIVVDLRLVRFLSAAGLCELVRGHQQCRRSGIPLRVVADQRAVTRPLSVTGLDRTLGLRPDLDTPGNIPADPPTSASTAAVASDQNVPLAATAAARADLPR